MRGTVRGSFWSRARYNQGLDEERAMTEQPGRHGAPEDGDAGADGVDDDTEVRKSTLDAWEELWPEVSVSDQDEPGEDEVGVSESGVEDEPGGEDDAAEAETLAEPEPEPEPEPETETETDP